MSEKDDEAGGYAVLPNFLNLDAARTVEVSQWRQAANYAYLTGEKVHRSSAV